MNILLTCAGRRKYLVDYFKQELGDKGRVVGADMTASAPALAGCDAYHLVPAVDSADYIKCLLDISKQESIDAIISLNDIELPVLSQAKEQFGAIGVTVIVADEEQVRICGDKFATVEFARQLNIPVPKSYLSVESALSDINNNSLVYPLIVKPRWGSASIGLFVVNSSAELEDAFVSCLRTLQSSFLAKLATDSSIVLIQEYISGPEYGVDIFNDLSGNNLGVVLKKKLAMRAGETDKAITISSERLESFAKTIGTELKHIGNLDCDFLERDGEFYLLEMNPRFGGGYPFSHESGANLVKAMIQCLEGKSADVSILYNAGAAFAKCDVLVPVSS